MDKIFGKKKTVEQQLRDQDKEMRRNQRGLQRDRAGLEKGKKNLFYENLLSEIVKDNTVKLKIEL